jgi:hypothetical protein
MRIILFLLVFSIWFTTLRAQLKFVIEDFEGFTDGISDLKPNGVFVFGNIKAGVSSKPAPQPAYAGERQVNLTVSGPEKYGGWGKGMGVNLNLDVSVDHFNFYIIQPVSNGSTQLKIELQEDDNGNNIYEKDHDDSWTFISKTESDDKWHLISIPLIKFTDTNKGGDGIFNISYKDGKLFTLIITFLNTNPAKPQSWSFDMLCFSKGKLPTGLNILDAPSAGINDHCSLGAWSKEGNTANYYEIPKCFEALFQPGSEKKLGVVHFFQSFAFDGGTNQNQYPSVERINKVIEHGYIPMITLEDHFVNSTPHTKQPNLYSIIEGHFNNFFVEWANSIKQVKGTVLLRILHEFNGDWYPWCTVNNDKNPELVKKAYCHIHAIFKANNVTNVKFIWCPNSMSAPQEKWNYIMDAYPGDPFVDYVGLDIYNGAGQGTPVWRSFRKEGIENYFILTQQLPNKPLLICETASRERRTSETGSRQDKADWIRQMSDALSTDMSKVRLIAWFNEKETFRINSSEEAKNAFLTYILKDDFYKGGKDHLIIR